MLVTFFTDRLSHCSPELSETLRLFFEQTNAHAPTKEILWSERNATSSLHVIYVSFISPLILCSLNAISSCVKLSYFVSSLASGFSTYLHFKTLEINTVTKIQKRLYCSCWFFTVISCLLVCVEMAQQYIKSFL